MSKKKLLFIVDDDALYLTSLRIEFQQYSDFIVETFSTGELCVEKLHSNPSVVILDYHLDGIVDKAMNGLETLDKIRSFNSLIPVIILSSQDKIEVAVECMHHKAFDYIVKSETTLVRLHKAIENIFSFRKIQQELDWYMKRA
jgi:two-component system OmpR family response regulator